MDRRRGVWKPPLVQVKTGTLEKTITPLRAEFHPSDARDDGISGFEHEEKRTARPPRGERVF
ncbi:hypothetical protein LY76DRAFT_596537 [Colletotrichum caudatum]|nr:hypothetical protein LY76DRAFT_596537 [Colletotrichum caudatum]